MSRLEAVYLDVDGVLCDLVKSAMLVHGRGEVLANGAWPKGVYDLEDIVGVTREEFWGEVHKYGHLFWEHLEPFHWMGKLVDAARAAAPQVVLLTKPTDSPHSTHGKHCWIQKHFGYGFRDYAITARKSHMAAPGRLLIDDYDKNISEWIDAGGIGLLFPQPWNPGTGDYMTVLEELNRYAAA